MRSPPIINYAITYPKLYVVSGDGEVQSKVFDVDFSLNEFLQLDYMSVMASTAWKEETYFIATTFLGSVRKSAQLLERVCQIEVDQLPNTSTVRKHPSI